MPARKGLHSDTPGHSAEIETALVLARRRLRWSRAMQGLAATFFVPAAGGAIWVAVSRFTMLEPPRWPVVIPAAVWLIVLAAWSALYRPGRSRAARYLDAALGLENRLSTLLEVEGRARIGAALVSPIQDRLAADTIQAIKLSTTSAGTHLRVRVGRAAAAAGILSIAFLGASILLPTTLDAAKAERRELKAALETQAQRIEQFRAELVTRPGVPDSLRHSLDSEMAELQKQLASGNLSRADALAAMSAAEQKIRELSPSVSPAEFEPLVRAALLVQAGAAQYTDWDPALTEEKNDLGKAAEALDHTGGYVSQFSATGARGMASSLERASTESAEKDSLLAENLATAGSALRAQEQDPARTALRAARERFREAEERQQSAQAVENALAKLSDGRQTIGKAGAPVAKKQQVGFRRPEAAGSQAGGASSAANQAQGGQPQGTTVAGSASTRGPAGQSGTPSSSGNIGQSQPAFGVKPGAGSGGQTTSGAGQGGQQSGSAQGGQPGVATGSGSGGTSNGSGGGSGGTGNQQGAISGPVRVGGASGGGSNAAGVGVGSSPASGQSSSSEQSTERIYVPGQSEPSRGPLGGQASPESSPGGVAGRVGSGAAGEGTVTEPGIGAANTVRTPYQEVLGDYARQATDALDRAYVPPDAKDYVRSYFAELGK